LGREEEEVKESKEEEDRRRHSLSPTQIPAKSMIRQKQLGVQKRDRSN